VLSSEVYILSYILDVKVVGVGPLAPLGPSFQLRLTLTEPSPSTVTGLGAGDVVGDACVLTSRHPGSELTVITVTQNGYSVTVLREPLGHHENMHDDLMHEKTIESSE
jgi:hypothetical protein